MAFPELGRAIGAVGALEEGARVLVGGGGAVRGCAATREGLGGSVCVVVAVVGSLVTGRGTGCESCHAATCGAA